MTRHPLKFVLVSGLCLLLAGCANNDWRAASRASAGIAPLPAADKHAVIEVYAADAFSWRGWFAVHTWIATKAENADTYDVLEVVGWGVKHGRPALRNYQTTTPDRYWYGAKPEKLLSVTGEKAARLIPQIHAAAEKYPWKMEYQVFPGPNSNTFPAWIALKVPELGLELPFRAIGSGYADNDDSALIDPQQQHPDNSN